MPSTVPRLFDLAKKVLQQNVHSIQDVGDVPYEMLRDILPGCKVPQLAAIEELSPQIAEEDDEIWEMFFKRDFPLAAETRQASLDRLSSDPPASNQTKRLTSPSKFESDYDSLFCSFRDLYNDAEIAREEKLAKAGTRLKEKIASLKQQKEERRVVLDPRLGLQTNKYRRRSAPIKTLWSNGSQYRPKTITERARVKANAIAIAYRPPKAIARHSVRIACMDTDPKKPKPAYIEIDDSDATLDQAGTSSNNRTSNKPSTTTRFIERTISTKARSTIEKPYKESIGIPKQPKVTMLPQAHANNIAAPQPEAMSKLAPAKSPRMSLNSSPTEQPMSRPIKNIPGITRRPKPLNKADARPSSPVSTRDPTPPSSATSLSQSSSSVPPTPVYATLSPPLWTQTCAQQNVRPDSPPLGIPPAPIRKPIPSIFMPRKRQKV